MAHIEYDGIRKWRPFVFHNNPVNAENGSKGTCFATSEFGNAVAVALGQERLS